jgi:hypothetical protein
VNVRRDFPEAMLRGKNRGFSTKPNYPSATASRVPIVNAASW